MKTLSCFKFQAKSSHISRQDTLQKRLSLICHLLDVAETSRSKWLQMIVVSKFFQYRLDGLNRSLAAEKSLECLPPYVSSCSRSVLNWSKNFQNAEMPKSLCGRHQKTYSIMNDEDVDKRCVAWLRTQQPNQRTPKKFQEFIVSDVLPSVIGSANATLPEESARKWMVRLGYKYGT
jgi:hypothetical protein